MGIDAHQLAIVMGITVAGAGRARLDVAHHRARIAADLVGGSSSRISRHEQALQAQRQTVERCRPATMRGGTITGVGLSYRWPPGILFVYE
jgi:hypothetical protein